MVSPQCCMPGARLAPPPPAVLRSAPKRRSVPKKGAARRGIFRRVVLRTGHRARETIGFYASSVHICSAVSRCRGSRDVEAADARERKPEQAG